MMDVAFNKVLPTAFVLCIVNISVRASVLGAACCSSDSECFVFSTLVVTVVGYCALVVYTVSCKLSILNINHVKYFS